MDLDQNGYPGMRENAPPRDICQLFVFFFDIFIYFTFSFADLVVGAFGADKAVLYRYVRPLSRFATKIKDALLILFLCHH